MKQAIKVLILAGALLSVGALAQSQTQTWNYNFPQFMALYSSVATVNFDFDSSIADGNTTTLPSRAYPRASGLAVDDCLGGIDPDGNPNTGTGTVESVTEGSLTASCTFAPSDLDKNFDVVWTSGDAEGALITISNVATKIQVSVDSDPTSGITLQVANSKTSTSEPAFQDITTTDADFITALSAGIHYLPLTFALEVDITTVALSAAETRTVTYTITNP